MSKMRKRTPRTIRNILSILFGVGVILLIAVVMAKSSNHSEKSNVSQLDVTTISKTPQATKLNIPNLITNQKDFNNALEKKPKRIVFVSHKCKTCLIYQNSLTALMDKNKSDNKYQIIVDVSDVKLDDVGDETYRKAFDEYTNPDGTHTVPTMLSFDTDKNGSLVVHKHNLEPKGGTNER